MARIRPAKFLHGVYRTRRYDQMVHWYKVVFDAEGFVPCTWGR